MICELLPTATHGWRNISITLIDFGKGRSEAFLTQTVIDSAL
jgi:hypothetical protein